VAISALVAPTFPDGNEGGGNTKRVSRLHGRCGGQTVGDCSLRIQLLLGREFFDGSASQYVFVPGTSSYDVLAKSFERTRVKAAKFFRQGVLKLQALQCSEGRSSFRRSAERVLQ
jgi:hypothetical protein